VLLPRQRSKLARSAKDKEHTISLMPLSGFATATAGLALIADATAHGHRSPVGRLAVRGRTTPVTGPAGPLPWRLGWATSGLMHCKKTSMRIFAHRHKASRSLTRTPLSPTELIV
jgi:hypothetical protein